MHLVPPLGGPCRNIVIPFGMEKLEWWATRWWKNFVDIYNCLHTISACDGRTDRRTDILPLHSPRYAYASRGRNPDAMGRQDYARWCETYVSALIKVLSNNLERR